MTEPIYIQSINLVITITGESITVICMDDMGKHSIGPPDVTRPEDKSTVRKRILQFLDHAGAECSAYDISNGTGICYSHVRGGLNGSVGRWSGKKSLVSTGLVQTRNFDDNIVLYSLTDKGRDSVRGMNIREGRHDRDVQLDQEI
jgi:predicted transcriptional regulator with HTH domain